MRRRRGLQASRRHLSVTSIVTSHLRHRPSVPLPARTGPSFARGLWRIAAADVSSGNRVRLLHDGSLAFDAMELLIDGAKHSVALECYIFRSDEVGQRFGEALIAAVGRGVRVRLLMDWIGARGISRGFVATLRAGGVEVQVFNPPGFRRWLGLVPRDHRKLLVVDDAVGITGGVGIGVEWMRGVAHKRRSQWRDTAIRIEGPAARDMIQAFEKMWRRAAGKHRRRSRLIRKRPSGAHLDPATHARSLVGIIEGEPLTGAARDGVDVRVLVPSRNDHPWVTMLTRRYYHRLLRNGVRIWEWRGEMMHAKSSVIDGRWVRVGSTDFNVLGVAINYELDAIVEDQEIGRQAEERFLADLEESREVTKRSRVVSRP